MRLDLIDLVQRQVDEIIAGMRYACAAGWRFIRRAEG
jgi:hypothetical protein